MYDGSITPAAELVISAPSSSAEDFFKAYFANCHNVEEAQRSFVSCSWMREGPKEAPVALKGVQLPSFFAQINATAAIYPHTHFYFSTALMVGEGGRKGKEHASVMVGCFADIDFIADGKDKPLPANEAEAMRMFEDGGFPPPTMIVRSGRGLHGHWLLQTPCVMDTDQKYDKMYERKKAFYAAFRAFAKERFGWDFDVGVFDMARLARVPGSQNHKVNPPLPVTWSLVGEGRSYTEEAIDAHIATYPQAWSERKPPVVLVCGAKNGGVGPANVVKVWEDIAKLEKKRRSSDEEKAIPPIHFSAVAAGCGWMRHVINDAATLPYAEWLQAINIASHCDHGSDAAHLISAPHPQYDLQKTQEMINDVRTKDVAPTTCEYIQNGLARPECVTCPFNGKIRSPLLLAGRERTAAYVKLLTDWVYLAKSDSFHNPTHDLPAMRTEGLGRTGFSGLFGPIHGSGAVGGTASRFLADPLSMRGIEQTYDPAKTSGFIAGKSHDDAIFNTYRKSDIEPVEGDVTEFMWFFRRLFGENVDYALKYFAHLYQYPWLKIRFAMVLISEQGIGKGELFKMLERLYGASNCKQSASAEITGNYLGQIGDKVLHLINELDAADKQGTYNAIKEMIADDVMSACVKYENTRIMSTPRGNFIATQKDVPLKIEGSDRRLWVLDRRNVVPFNGDPEAKARLGQLLDHIEDHLPAIAHVLATYSLDGFDRHDAPMTDAKEELIHNSMSQLTILAKEAFGAGKGVWALPVMDARTVRDALKVLNGGITPTETAITATMRDLGGRRPKENSSQWVKFGGDEKLRLRFWVLRDHARWIDLPAVSLRDAYQLLLAANGAADELRQQSGQISQHGHFRPDLNGKLIATRDRVRRN